MPKGYWIANNIVHDAKKYEDYKALNAVAFATYGAKFLVRGGAQQDREGSVFPRTVVIEFPTYQAAVACYESPEYKTALDVRLGVAEGNLTIVEGYEG